MKDKNNGYTTEYTFSECGMRLIRSLVSMELLFYGLRTILSSSFENWVLSGKAIAWIQFLLITVIVVNELIPLLGRQNMVRIRVLLEVFLLGWLGWNIWKSRIELWTSYQAWFDDYLPYWNAYMETDYLPYKAGGTMGYAFSFTVLLVLLCMLILRYVSNRRVFLILPNILAVSAALFVNVCPDTKSLFISFAGVLVLFSGGWEAGKIQIHTRIGKQQPAGRRAKAQCIAIGGTLIIAGIIVGVTMLCFRGSAEKIPDYMPQFLAFQQNAEEWVMSLGKGGHSDYEADKAKVDNSTPEYQDETIVTIYTNQVPRTNLYLKSFCSSTYENSTWQPLDNAYEVKAGEKGIDSANLAVMLRQNTYEKVIKLEEPLRNSYGITKSNMSIDYENPKTKLALVPYFSDLSGSEEKLWIEKDAVVHKGKESSVSFRQWLLPWVDIISYSYIYGDTGDSEQEDGLDWYNNFVMEHDRVGTSEIPMIQHYKENVTLALEGRERTAGKEESISYMDNAERREIADEVRNQLFKDTSYNLYLDSLPTGVDPIQYFLETGKEGYCMHYASAGTLILQELGVPARYASGFVVKQGLFTKVGGGEITEKDFTEKNKNQYTATVKDRCAHAWVEIYMDGIGWVPYDMTPGYTTLDGDLPTDEKYSDMLKQEHEEHKQEKLSTEQETSQSTEQETKQPTENSESSEAEMSKASESIASTEGGIETATGNHRGKGYRIIALIVVLALIFLGVVSAGGYRIRHSYRERLLRELRARRNRNAIRRINRRIYRGLMKGRPMDTARISRSGRFDIHMRPLTDMEYEKKLQKAYPSITAQDWHRYMQIVKKCAFSHEKISDEEAQFCYRIYKLRYRNKG